MGSFDALLELQEHDSAVERLRARRERLPERPQLVERRAAAEVFQAQLDGLLTAREEAARDEKRLDDTAGAIRERMAEVERTMYKGSVTSPRELQAMQAEVEQFKRQLRSLEDQELDVMERREGLDTEIGEIQDRLATVRASADELEGALTEQEAAIDGEIAGEVTARAALVPSLPTDLLELYEKIRNRGGVAAARLVGGTCQACHLALPAMEVDRIKRAPADALVRCDQCGAILVRD